MQYFKVLTLTLYCLLFTYSFSSTEAAQPSLVTEASTAVYPSWQEVVEYAGENLPLDGHLMMKSGGFVYVKVDDEYIHTLFPMLGLNEEGFKKPPYFRSSEASGAHISVFYEDENIMPEEIGSTFTFKLKRIVIVQASKYVQYAILEVESPELEKLRKKYGLSPKLHGHEYHISLAKKVMGSNKK